MQEDFEGRENKDIFNSDVSMCTTHKLLFRVHVKLTSLPTYKNIISPSTITHSNMSIYSENFFKATSYNLFPGGSISQQYTNSIGSGGQDLMSGETDFSSSLLYFS